MYEKQAKEETNMKVGGKKISYLLSDFHPISSCKMSVIVATSQS
jgi:hypothetical protein